MAAKPTGPTQGQQLNSQGGPVDAMTFTSGSGERGYHFCGRSRAWVDTRPANSRLPAHCRIPEWPRWATRAMDDGAAKSHFGRQSGLLAGRRGGAAARSATLGFAAATTQDSERQRRAAPCPARVGFYWPNMLRQPVAAFAESSSQRGAASVTEGAVYHVGLYDM
jgi:hypothetical protein